MKVLIDVFRMTEVSVQTRINILKKLGRAIDYEHAANVTGELVDELVKMLEEQLNE
jgi:hypothetical protein